MSSIAVSHWDEGRMVVNAAFAALLRHNGLTDAASLWALAGEPVKRRLKERGTDRVVLRGIDGAPVEAFLKRYLPLPAREYLKSWLGGKPLFTDGALHEWEALVAFHEHDLPTIIPLAAARLPDGRSCCLTLGLGPHCRASDLLPRLLSAGTAARQERLALIRRIAELVGRMHRAHFAHQDCYLVHFFVLERDNEQAIALIDLQRVILPGQFRRRWQVKDLAQLLYSAPAQLSRSDRWRFWCEYVALAGPELRRDRTLLRAILAKAGRMSRRARRR